MKQPHGHEGPDFDGLPDLNFYPSLEGLESTWKVEDLSGFESTWKDEDLEDYYKDLDRGQPFKKEVSAIPETTDQERSTNEVSAIPDTPDQERSTKELSAIPDIPDTPDQERSTNELSAIPDTVDPEYDVRGTEDHPVMKDEERSIDTSHVDSDRTVTGNGCAFETGSPPPHSNSLTSTVSRDVTDFFVTDEVFLSRAELVAWCQAQGKKANTVVVIQRSSVAKRTQKARLTLGCERGGVFRHGKRQKTKLEVEEFEKQKTFQIAKRALEGLSGLRTKPTDPRHSSTTKCECPFLLKGIPLELDSWKVSVVSGIHNHEVAATLVGHAYVGRLKTHEKEMLKDMTLTGARPREVLATLKRRDPENVSTARALYNAKHKGRLGDMEGRSGVQQLLKHLNDNHYIHFMEKSANEATVENIFWAHTQSILLAKCFPSVLLLDCTYRTNRYNMPLLQICGTTSTGNTFCVAFAFLTSEKESSYAWALSKLKLIFEPHALPQVFVTDRELALVNAIHSIFPEASHMLCTYHIRKNVEAKIRNKSSPLFHGSLWKTFLSDWIDLSESPTESAFDRGWVSFVGTWSMCPTLIDYIVTYWMPYKEKFVHAWTNLIKHRGHNTTNKVEGQHANLKKHIDASNGSFHVVWLSMHNMLLGQIVKIEATFEQSMTNTKHAHLSPCLDLLRGYVSHLALTQLTEEIARVELLPEGTDGCDHVLRNVYGLPCAHELRNYLKDGIPVPLDAVDCHWRKLSIAPDITPFADVEFLPAMLLFKKKWGDSTAPEKVYLERKLREICVPEITPVGEPANVKPKGRKRGIKVNKPELANEKSTKRYPSSFELAEMAATSYARAALEKGLASNKKPQVGPKSSKPNQGLESSSKLWSRVLGTSNRPVPRKDAWRSLPGASASETFTEYTEMKRKSLFETLAKKAEDFDLMPTPDVPPSPKTVAHMRSTQGVIDLLDKRWLRRNMLQKTVGPQDLDSKGDQAYFERLPVGTQAYVQSVRNVADDGNCGYRAVSASYGIDETGWRVVRFNLLSQMVAYRTLYESMFAPLYNHVNVHKALSVTNSPCGLSAWMTMPDMGQMIADKYDCVFVLLSKAQSLTFVPLKRPPPVGDQPRTIVIALIGLHFISVTLKPDAPLPRILSNWEDHCTPDALVWKTVLASRIQQFLLDNPEIGNPGAHVILSSEKKKRKPDNTSTDSDSEVLRTVLELGTPRTLIL